MVLPNNNGCLISSFDEAKASGLEIREPHHLVRLRMGQHTGIPTCVGSAPTKTLAKLLAWSRPGNHNWACLSAL